MKPLDSPQRLPPSATLPAAPVAPAPAIHIERLVLDGLSLHQRNAPQLQAALESELARLLAGTPPRRSVDETLASLPAVDLQWQPAAGPERLGRSIALALRRALGERGLL